ncbi:hypothetical protein [Silvimonas soli]|uniref:hypothetical protein n=1 Tax=Silvimonas soli TaxID=2980100 RepID=UPI0024B39CBB|nr:hypothetical protein [Silvimonas soli]
MPTQSERRNQRQKELKEKIDLVLEKLAARGITGEAYDEIAKKIQYLSILLCSRASWK